MKAIVTKYHGPTDTKGSRISASDEDGNKITISYPYELSGEAVHRAAAQALCDKMEWSGTLVGGSLKNGYVFTFAPSRSNLAQWLFEQDCKAEKSAAEWPKDAEKQPYCQSYLRDAESILAYIGGAL